ncbi:MAG: type II toxin-antitoxin system prevent-host-death family antitoxin [Rhizobiaceae bacterium]|nr:type II toxin-antitoxin system prevent-host-death family antitoxin [Rhizobiaceae bacterium]
MVTVTAAELQERFERYRHIARTEPVSVTDEGAGALVIVSAEEYRRLKALDERGSFHAWELPDDLLMALETSEAPDETAGYDHELR